MTPNLRQIFAFNKMNEHFKESCHVFMLNEINDLNASILNRSYEINDCDTLILKNETIKVRKRTPRQDKVNRVPRPPNAFILYRKDKQFDVMTQNKNLTNAQVSKPKKRTKDTSKNSSKMISAKTLSTLSPPREESIINQIPYQTYSNDISYFNDIPTYFNELYYTLELPLNNLDMIYYMIL
ncbi:12303_t:CDS:2 [Dentiscutata heterogama]|uniref:12303_t:CDS:1 n=1 Tax=Dentiscutata heterogama TaxID=1316150 RepID=A0ACA9M2B3_9GLOM|nr:12303_t:CDS:2 [Dentiscutata heterogama]